MPDMEKVIAGLEFTKAMITFNPLTGEDIEPGNLNEADKTSYDACVGAIALLKEQEAKERKWLQTIADNQIANAPKDSPMSLDEQLESEYKSGIYDGLQMAFEILTEGR